MTPRFCGNCGAQAPLANLYCVACGKPLAPYFPRDASPAESPPSSAVPSETPIVAPPAQGPIPWTPWVPSPPKPKARRTTLIIVVVLVVLAIVAVAVVALLVLQPRASFVGITKTGVTQERMHFDVRIRTSGASIGVDRLHVHIKSVRSALTFDAVVFYNVDTIPAGTTFAWDLDVLIDPLDEASFSYLFTLELNGTQMDASTVT